LVEVVVFGEVTVVIGFDVDFVTAAAFSVLIEAKKRHRNNSKNTGYLNIF